MAQAAELLGDRWTLLILREAFYGVVRYEDMQADLSAPRSMLTERLSRLVKSGLLERRPYREPGSRTRQAYVLTDAGKALGPTLMAMSAWGEGHLMGHPAAVEFVTSTTRSPVRIALLDDNDQVTPLAEVRIQLRQSEQGQT